MKALCINCDKELVPVFEGSEQNYQYVDGLDIQIRLGWGEFRDQEPDKDGSPRAVFCSMCAKHLCDIFPGIRRMLGE